MGEDQSFGLEGFLEALGRRLRAMDEMAWRDETLRIPIDRPAGFLSSRDYRGDIVDTHLPALAKDLDGRGIRLHWEVKSSDAAGVIAHAMPRLGHGGSGREIAVFAPAIGSRLAPRSDEGAMRFAVTGRVGRLSRDVYDIDVFSPGFASLLDAFRELQRGYDPSPALRSAVLAGPRREAPPPSPPTPVPSVAAPRTRMRLIMAGD